MKYRIALQILFFLSITRDPYDGKHKERKKKQKGKHDL